MRGAVIHGALLAVMLVFGYRTWTRDKTVRPDLGSVVLWDKSESDLVSLEYKTDKKTVKVEHRGSGKDAYWWGSETSGEKDKQKTREFPLGKSGEDLVKAYTAARAQREIGKPTDAQKKDYKLDDTKATLVATFKDGARTFQVGGSVYGNSDRYVIEPATGNAYVLSKDMISPLDLGESNLHLVDPRGFDPAQLGGVTLTAGDKSKHVERITVEAAASPGQTEGKQSKTWGDPATKKADVVMATFIDSTTNLKPTDYAPDVKVADLTPIMKLAFTDDKGGSLGTLQLFKREKPGVLPPGTELDPANPPKGETEYLILTEKTRVPAVVRKDPAQRVEGDVANVLSDHPVEPPKSVDPHGNPFGKMPLPATPPKAPPGMGSGSAAVMPGTTPPAGAGSGAPAAAGSGAGSGSSVPAKAPTPAAGSAAPKAPTPTPAAGSAAPKAAPASAGSGSVH